MEFDGSCARLTLLVKVMQDVVNAYDIRQSRSAWLEAPVQMNPTTNYQQTPASRPLQPFMMRPAMSQMGQAFQPNAMSSPRQPFYEPNNRFNASTSQSPANYLSTTAMPVYDPYNETGCVAFPSNLFGIYESALPRLTVSCHTCARIGLTDEISKAFFSKLVDPSDPTDLECLEGGRGSNLKDQLVYENQPNGQLKIKSVAGRADENIGVENLQGSGLIVGETSAAYDVLLRIAT